MKISVVTVVYNDKKGIEQTIRSVISQTVCDKLEYIIIDGESTDGTSKIINGFKDRVDKYIREPDTGIYNAMNKGLKFSSGDYIIFLNSGDKFSTNHVIEDIISNIGDLRPEVVYGSYREVDDKGNAKRVIPCRSKGKIWYGPVASHQSTFYKLEYLRQHNLIYDESYKIAADYKLTTQAIISAENVLKTDICVNDFDVNGISSINQNLGLKEANRVRKEVLGWGTIRIIALSMVLLVARYTKKFLFPVYKILRY